MSLAEVRSNIVSVVGTTLPTANVAEHGGPITASEVKRWATKSPAVRIACLGVPKVQVGPRILMDASWAAFCLESDRPGTANHRDMRVLLLAQSVIAVVSQNGQRWNNKATSAPTGIMAVNLYAQDIDGLGVALWAVRWRQVIEVNEVDITGFDNFETFFAQYDVGPDEDTPITEQQITLEGPWP